MRRTRAGGAAAIGIITALLTAPALGQGEPPDGMRPVDLRAHAITNANVVVRPGEVIENATIVIRDGLIKSVTADGEATIPPGSRVWDASDRIIYPGLIDAAVLVEPGELEQGPLAHWNRLIHPEVHAADLQAPDDGLAKQLRDLGFTTAAVYPEDGILRGSGVVLSLAGDGHDRSVYRETAALAAGFDRGGGYPGSLMGSIALLRQTLSDARWYERAQQIWLEHPQGNEPPDRSDSFDALLAAINGEQQVLFEASDEHNVLRAAKVVEEFDLDAIVLGSGYEFRRGEDVAATRLPLILPLNFPERPTVSSLSEADNTTLRDLMTWEQAPTNPRRMLEHGSTVALTTHGLRNRNDFFANLRLAVHNGLSKDDALAAMTTTPATMLGIEDITGSITPGRIANLIVVEGDLFDKDMTIREVWIDGRRYEINPVEDDPYATAATLIVTRAAGAAPLEAKAKIDTSKKTVEITTADDHTYKAKQVSYENDILSFLIDGRLLGTTGYVQFSGAVIENEVTGTGALPDRSRFTFTITPTDEEAEAEEPAEEGEEGEGEGEGEEEDAANDAGDEADAPEGDPISGEWEATLRSDNFGEMPFSMSLQRGEEDEVTGSMESEFFTAELENGSFDADTSNLSLTVAAEGMSSRITATVTGDQMQGTIESDAFRADFSAARVGGDEEEGDDERGRSRRNRRDLDESDIAPPQLVYPLGAYGVTDAPQQQNVVVFNATIWTCGPDGIIDNGWMVVENGKIAQIGSGEFDRSGRSGFEMIDAGGRHITPGLIDCHSHTGIDGGVNEGSQAVTAEVRIGDVIDPDDINWYRQLAGGLTAANQLHGSANPIGGQNSVVKLKWGASADDMPVEGAIPGIKFALGENVKRAQQRYPNTRMGVETLIRDSFVAATDYRAEWQRYNAMSDDEKAQTIPPRRDLELEALVEILEDERLVHCHSYRQDEILALLRTAEEFGFTIGTLQHILEGYKVAEAISEHGAGASSFSDWWAYKMEVMDAIPYNGALMHRVGIVVSFNSDSSELARRMNTEAAKAVRYGGVEPHEALKFVSLNPAKQLRIDDRTGSLEAGKDADFVIWSGDPLSTYTRCEQTWIEGARYFSIEDDAGMRERIAAERQRLIQKILTKEHGELGEEEESEEEGDDEGEGDETEPPGLFDFSANFPF